ncbi:MAG TPA: hypothetical protein VM779_10560 [Thermoanaerobaculia bacterium]|nr:hypothetical protein [Thermoanaerobaculia bacterium]
MIVFLLLVTAVFRPSAPAVGDLITVEFEQAVVLDPSDAYELVSQDGRTVVVRTFRPEPIEISGRMGNIVFRKLVLPVRSVLAPDDEMKPAPLKPPAEPAASRVPWIALGTAGAVAALAWVAVMLLARRKTTVAMPAPILSPAEQFRSTVHRLRRSPGQAGRWAALADATRVYVAAVEPPLGLELTTAEFLRALRATNISGQNVAAAILRQGDLEKFSPWGAAAADFDRVAQGALDLIPQPAMEEAA